MSTPAVRWGLLGAGWIAQRAIAPAIHEAWGAELVAVASRERARAEALEPMGYSTQRYAEVIDDDGIDAIFIALDNAGHEEWSIAALRAGKVVLCEKPLGMHPASVHRIRAVEQECGGLLVEASWNLWHPRTQRAMQIVHSGELGGVRAVRGAFTFEGVPADNYRHDPARGGGAMLDVGCYPLMATAWAMPGEALQCVSSQVTRSESGVDLTTESAFAVAAGGQATGPAEVLASFERPEHQSLRIEAEGGIVEFTGGDAFTSYRATSTLEIGSGDAVRVEEFAPVDAYGVMIEHVSRAARGEPSWLPERAWSAVVAEAIADALAHPRGNRPPKG